MLKEERQSQERSIEEAENRLKEIEERTKQAEKRAEEAARLRPAQVGGVRARGPSA